jgi:hypothetical protein
VLQHLETLTEPPLPPAHAPGPFAVPSPACTLDADMLLRRPRWAPWHGCPLHRRQAMGGHDGDGVGMCYHSDAVPDCNLTASVCRADADCRNKGGSEELAGDRLTSASQDCRGHGNWLTCSHEVALGCRSDALRCRARDTGQRLGARQTSCQLMERRRASVRG